MGWVACVILPANALMDFEMSMLPDWKTDRIGVTLVELLVVMVVIGILLAMLFPAMQLARTAARRSQCKSNLKQIGLAMTHYLDQQGPLGRFPDAIMLPSLDPTRPSIFDVLAPYCESNRELFHCPSDVKRYYEHLEKSYEYFANEGLSYEYPSVRLAGRTRQQVLETRFGTLGTSDVWIVYDYASFHGQSGERGSRNYLYLDGHVDALVVAE